MNINPYLIFNGNCEEAFLFYQSVFGGEIPYMGRYSDMPPSEKGKVSEDEARKVMHVSLPIGSDTVLMGSDTGGEWAASHVAGNNFNLSISAVSRDEADRLFQALSAGGTVKLPMAEVFWGDYFGMLTDRFGINWMISGGNKPASD